MDLTTLRQFGKAKPASFEPALGAALYLELASSMLRAGLSLSDCLLRLGELEGGRHRQVCAAVVLRLHAGASWSQAWEGLEVADALLPLKDSLGFMLETGAPGAELLEVLAQRQRRQGYRASEKSAAKLSVKLVVPLGLCSLPAFICLGVVPVLISLVPTIVP